MEKPRENGKLCTAIIRGNNSESGTATGHCQNVEDFHMEQVKSGAPEVDVLIDLALLQYHCTKRLIENQNEELFYVEQQVVLQKKIMILIGKVEPRLFKIDEYSATALMLFLSDFNQLLFDDRSFFKARLAQSVAYYLKYLLRNRGTKVRSKRSIESYKDGDIVNPFSKEYVESRIDYAHIFQLYKENVKALDGIKNVKASEGIENVEKLVGEKRAEVLEKMRVFVEDFLRFAGELLESKTTIAETKGSNVRVVERLSALIKSVKSIKSIVIFRNLKTHGQFCRDIKLSDQMIVEFAYKFRTDEDSNPVSGLTGIRDVLIKMMDKLGTGHIAEIFDECKNENLKSFLEKKGLSKKTLEYQDVEDIEQRVGDIRNIPGFSVFKDEGKKLLTEIESRLKVMNSGHMKKLELRDSEEEFGRNTEKTKILLEQLDVFVYKENKQTTEYLTDEIMKKPEIKNLSKEFAERKLTEFVDSLHEEAISRELGKLIMENRYSHVLVTLRKDKDRKKIATRIAQGEEFRETVEQIADIMVRKGLTGGTIENCFKSVLSQGQLTEGVNLVREEYLRILRQRKDSYFEEIKKSNTKIMSADTLLIVHDLLTKIDDLAGIYESIDWRSDKGGLERAKEVVKRIEEFGKKDVLESKFKKEFDGQSANKVIGDCSNEIEKSKKRGEALSTDLKEKIGKIDGIIKKTIDSVETKFFDRVRNSISHIDITKEGELIDKLKSEKDIALEIFKKVMNENGTRTSKFLFEKELISIQQNGSKSDYKKYKALSGLIGKDFNICAGSSQSKSKFAPGGRKLLGFIDKPMFQLGKGCFEIEEVKKFAEVDKEHKITSIDGRKILSSIEEARNKGDIETVDRLIDLANKYEVLGKDRLAVAQLSETHERCSNLERLGRISDHINQGLMAKDFLDDLSAGDYKDAFINAAFFVGDQGSSMMSNLASLQGSSYISEGKVLFGKSLKLAAPFISRMTSVFVAYDLYNRTTNYKEGDKDAKVSIILDSIQLSVDALSIGIEVGELAGLSALGGVSAVLGSIGGLLIFVGVQIYSAIDTVEKIDEKIHLTGMERFEEGLRAFMGIGIEKGLEMAIEEKEFNNQLVEGIVDFLKNNPHIKRAVFPSMSVEHKKLYSSDIVSGFAWWGLRWNPAVLIAEVISPKFDWYKTCYPEERIFKPHSDNEVFLDKKLNKDDLRWIRGAPGEADKGKIHFLIDKGENGETIFQWLKGDENEVAEGKVFCIPSATKEDGVSSTEKTYKSKDAIGVKYSKGRKGKATFINLTDGKNTIVGFSNKPNIFAIGQGYKNIKGGEDDDLFKFVRKSVHDQSPYIRGIMDGRGGTDTLDISSLSSEINNISMNFQNKNLLDNDNKLNLEVKNMNNFIGRKGKIDTVTAACDTRHVDARGGVNDSNYDTIAITDNVVCNYDAKVIIRPYTKVDSKPKAGVVRYIATEKEVGTASVNIATNSRCDHQFIFANYTLNDISSIETQESSILFSFAAANSKFKLLINGKPTTYSYQLSGSTKLIVGQKNLYALHNTQEPINRSAIERYSNIAKELKMNLVVQSNKEVVSVGHDHHDVLQNDPTAKISHLVGNGGENIFILKSGISIKNLPLAGVVLYNFDRRESTRDTLDLREINKRVKESLKSELTSSVNQIGKDLEVTLSTKSCRQVIKITLKDALENHWYKMLDILIESVLTIEKTDNSFKLSPKPLIFSDKYKTTFVVTPNDVERENSIEIKKSIGNYVFARDGDTLVITNALQSGTDKPSTVLLINFYIDDKMKTLNIKFDDKKMVLAEELNRIMKLIDKNDFHLKSEQFRTNGYASVISYRSSNKRLQHKCNEDALDLQLKLDYNLQQVRYHHDEPMSKEELMVENILGAIRNNDRKWLIEKESNLNIKGKEGETLLHIAAFKGYLDVIKYLVSKQVDLSTKDSLGKTVMNYAALGGSIEVIKYLIDKDIEVDFRSKEGKTSMQYAASAGHLPTMRYLISRGANLRATNRDQVTTLHYGVEGNSVNVIDYLLKQGFDINASTHCGITPIHYAAKKGSLEVIKYLVEHGADVSVKGSFGNTVLHYAAERGDVKIVSYFLERGVDIDTQNYLGNTPAHSASIRGNLDVVKYLRENGANINIENRNGEKAETILKKRGLIGQNNQSLSRNKYTNIDELVESLFDSVIRKDDSLFIDKNDIFRIQDQSGRTALHSAASKGYLVVARYLVEKAGAKVDSIDVVGQTPLYSAIFHDKLEVVRYLVEECGANISHEDNNRETPLHFALLNNRVLIIKYLLEQGAKVDAEDHDGRTTLHLAIYHNKQELAKYLIVKGKANVNAFDINGNTPVHYSSMKGDLNMIQYLVNKGGDIYEKDNEGKTPLDILREKGYEVTGIVKQFKLNVAMVDAVKRNDMKKVQELVSKGINTNIRDKFGQALLDHAVSNNLLNMARYLVNHGADISSVDGFCPMVSHEGNTIVSIEPCATNGSASSSIVNNIVGRVKRSISGLFGYSTDMNANVDSSQSIGTQNYAAPMKTGKDIPQSNRIDVDHGYGKTVTEDVDVYGNLLLLNGLVRKVTGEKFVPCSSAIQSMSDKEAMAYAMSITNEFEKVLKKAAKATKIKVPQDKLGYQLYTNVRPFVTASIVKGECDEIENMLRSAAKYISPEGNESFVKLVNIGIKNMLAFVDPEVSGIESMREVKASYGEGQPSSLFDQLVVQPVSQRSSIA